MDQHLLEEIKTICQGITLMIFSIGVLAFGYCFFQNTGGFAVCFYGGVLVLLVGFLWALSGWSRSDSDQNDSSQNSQKEDV